MLDTEVERRARYLESGATIVAAATFIGAILAISLGTLLVDWLRVDPARALMIGVGLTWLSSMCGLAWAQLTSVDAAKSPRT